MRASEEEIQGEGSRPSAFKVFGRDAHERAAVETVAAEQAAPRSAADDPFATPTDDEGDSFGAPPKRSGPPAPHAPRARHEVLEADFPVVTRATVRPTTPEPPAPEPPRAAEPEEDAPAPEARRALAPAVAAEARPDWYRDPAFWAHVTPLAGMLLILTGFGLVPGLLIENTAGRRDDFVRDQAREAVNFQLNYLLLNLAALITFTAPVVWPLSLAFGIVLPIQAALDVKNGKRHRYPLVPRWLD
ncbi:MAG: DUF4870 domain-containing protein [Planctomycetes bacterium]|nr:DUF4870 domain-containing protein [Planctomycetota bacterium]MCB9904979.1 DUF4870 domain-containing protein [Planctomycetota bacterium]